jgi:enterochelin esterase family protein
MTGQVNRIPVSPRLAALQDRIKTGDRAALHRFWQQVEAEGTPLVEPISGEEHDVYVTFLWRAGKETRNVVMTGGFNSFELTGDTLELLPDTDLWYKTFRFRNDLRATYVFSPNYPVMSPPIQDLNTWFEQMKNFKTDPMNKRTYVWPESILNYSKSSELVFSLFELPAAPPQPWLEKKPDSPHGTVEAMEFTSTILGNERTIWIYTPPDYVRSDRTATLSCSLLVVCDGFAFTQVVPTPTILDNLLAEGRIPPLVAVFISNATDRRHIELPCYEPFADFLALELIPWVREHFNVTSDQTGTVIAGSSFGALAAAFAGLRYPEVFGNILSQSGSYWWKPESDREYEWLPRQFEAADPLPLRFYLEIGLLETKHMIIANRHLYEILKAKGCTVHYREFYGGHEYLNWQGTLADGLTALMGKNK